MLTLILAESALETIPEELWQHPAVQSYAKKRNKHPKFIILDRSFHHHAMKTLSNSEKRGRPDIVHFCLLEALGSPLNREGFLRVFVHTCNDYVIDVAPETRLPRNYNRFVGLIEDLFQNERVPPKGRTLMTVERKTLKELVDQINVRYVLAFSKIGKPAILRDVVSNLSDAENSAVFIGGFPCGHFLDSTLELTKEVVSIDPEMLEAWTVTSRLMHEYECAISLPEKRIKAITRL